ncbi:xanthine phosphoribosyltransferase [Propionigenium maris DSM 9537]|uniref:Xanthine phosphoribosyltransferase n=1 Tax=Propionigenium maris DSM 9537 TaxID=1123000 RepID=A0A9W6LPA7_9FUSO|nr:xanthine phosphoribosyltransferase [Propionigenium maris]GLI58186.1 xanthine phosphoribosyltransferase [Propionigenium maris DSM 9537]
MEFLRSKIKEEGRVINATTLKVDSFLNHQLDPQLMLEMGKEFKKRFEGKGINKILTIEASGIAIGIMAGLAFDVPVVFAKKKKPSTMSDMYCTTVHSFTKKIDYDICLSKEFLKPGDRVLVVDDFLAMGNAIIGLEKIVAEAGAELCGVGIAIEKGFQEGGRIIRDRGIHLESLAILDTMEKDEVKFL